MSTDDGFKPPPDDAFQPPPDDGFQPGIDWDEPSGDRSTDDGSDDDIAALREQVAELAAQVEKQTEALELQDQAIGRLLDQRGGEIRPAPWLYHEKPADGENVDLLPTWVAWWNLRYAPVNDRRHKIPLCWQEHGGLAAEIATLYWSWLHAFILAKATADAAQNWHDRWLPGFLSRMPMWAPSSCFEGRHQAPFDPDQATWNRSSGPSAYAGTVSGDNDHGPTGLN